MEKRMNDVCTILNTDKVVQADMRDGVIVSGTHKIIVTVGKDAYVIVALQ